MFLQTIVFDASKSYDPDRSGPSRFEGLIYSWVCVVEDTSPRPCLTTMNETFGGRRLYLTTPLSTEADVNKTYILTFHIRDNATTRSPSTASTRIRLSSKRSLPIISLDTQPSTYRNFKASQGVTIKTTVSVLSSLAPQLAFWSLVSLQSPMLTEVIPRATPLLIAPGQQSVVTLTLPVSYLVDAARYTFRLTCGAARMEVEVQTNLPPYGGGLLIKPEEGWMLRTKFILSAYGWKDHEVDETSLLPLQYRFYYTSSSRWMQLPGASNLMTMSDVLLSSGIMRDNFTLPLEVG